MKLSRRNFLRSSISAAFIIGATGKVHALTAWPKQQRILIRFAIASDGHYGQPDTAYEALHRAMVWHLNKEHAFRPLDFTMINGDIIHNEPSFFGAVKSEWSKLEMPFHVSHGNHDMINETGWKEIWQTPWHYSFEKDDAAFVVLNSADDKGNYICPDIEWTKKTLDKFVDKKHVFVFMHITPLKWTGAALPCPGVVSLLTNYQNIKAIFHGHDHDEDGVKEEGGKHYFFDSHVAGNWGTEYHGYRIVEVIDDGSILTYQVNPLLPDYVNSNQLS